VGPNLAVLSAKEDGRTDRLHVIKQHGLVANWWEATGVQEFVRVEVTN